MEPAQANGADLAAQELIDLLDKEEDFFHIPHDRPLSPMPQHPGEKVLCETCLADPSQPSSGSHPTDEIDVLGFLQGRQSQDAIITHEQAELSALSPASLRGVGEAVQNSTRGTAQAAHIASYEDVRHPRRTRSSARSGPCFHGKRHVHS